MEFSRCSEHSVPRAASMRSQTSDPEELPGRREKGKLENQEAALGVAGLWAAVPAPLATASLCCPTELSSWIFPRNTPSSRGKQKQSYILTENGEEAPPKQYPQQMNSSLTPSLGC